MTGRSQREKANNTEVVKTVVTKPAKRKAKIIAARQAASALGKQNGHTKNKSVVAQSASNAIDDIFGQPASAPTQQIQAIMPSQPATVAKVKSGGSGTATAAANGKSSRVAGSKDDLFAKEPAKTRRYDAEGLPIYSVEELEIGKGKDTADCPFDCDCCF